MTKIKVSFQLSKRVFFFVIPVYAFPQLFILGRCYFVLNLLTFHVSYNLQLHCNSLGSSQCEDVRSQFRKVKNISSFAASVWLQNLLLDVNYSE